MKQAILKREHCNKYVSGTYITIVKEEEIPFIQKKILQIMPLDSGKFLVERIGK